MSARPTGGTALITPQQAARERAQRALREEAVAQVEAERDLGALPGEWLERGGLPPDMLAQIAEAGAGVEPLELSFAQTTEAMHLVDRAESALVGWGHANLDALVGPILPGELWLIGATTGNGKSTFLHNWQAYLASGGVTSLVFPLEVTPSEYRLRLACWHLGVSYDDVMTQRWDALGASRDEVRQWLAVALDTLRKNPCVHVAPPSLISWEVLHRWVEWGVVKTGTEVVVIDHLHRLDLEATTARDYRVAMSTLARRLKELAKRLGVAVVCAVQFNRDNNPLDDYLPAQLSRIKESGSLEQEADGVLMLSRDIDPNADAGDVRAVKERRKLPPEIARPGCMVVTCRKHRRAGGRARDRSVRLNVSDKERLTPWPTDYLGRET